MQNADATAEDVNPVCGDRLRLSLRCPGSRIAEACFLAYGCAATIACASVLTEIVAGMTPEAALELTRDDLAAALDGIPSRKKHAGTLAIEVLRAAIAQLPPNT